MAQPIVNPELPFVDEIPSGLQPGKMIRFQGVTHPNSDRFNINFATGPNSKPRDDTALHISVRLNQGYIARNSYRNGAWQDEQGSGKLPIGKAQSFEIIVLVDPNHYKVAVNGQHFCEFPHRIPYDEVTHLLLDGDVALTLISFEGIVLPGPETSTQSSQVNASGPGGPQFGLPQYGPPPGVYGPPPSNYGGYGPPGEEPQSDFGSFFEKAQGILAGAIATGAAEKILGGILHSNDNSQRQPQGYVHQNAKYGIYPDLPMQDTTPTPSGDPSRNFNNPQDTNLSNLIAGSGGTVTTGPQPTIQPSSPSGQNPSSLESILMGLLSGNSERSSAPDRAQNQSADMLSGILSNLLSGSQTDSTRSPAATGQAHSSDGLSGLLSSFLSPSPDVSTPNQPIQNQSPPGPPTSSSSDVLTNLLSSLMSPNDNPNQRNITSQSPSEQHIDPKQGNNTQAPNVEMLTSLLQGLLVKAREQHDSTRPIQERNPGAGDTSQQQYGQYPHPPQEERGPMESLLSGLLSGGGQQQSHGPQYGGDSSSGGLGGILGSLAGSFLNRPGHNQGH